jgi:hypothetical protein
MIGTGVTRSPYELTAHDRKACALLFDMQVETSAPALEARALKAGSNTDARVERKPPMSKQLWARCFISLGC